MQTTKHCHHTTIGCSISKRSVKTTFTDNQIKKGTADSHSDHMHNGAAEANASSASESMMPAATDIQDLSVDYKIEYLTDVEGNINYFNRFVDRSDIFSRDSQTGELIIKENCILVHGGDACDKGAGDIRIIKELTGLKQRCPDQVFLIMGNRDINKLRFGSELATGEFGDTDPSIVYWDPRHEPYTEWVQKHKCPKNSVTTLKWMLECTMGSATTFESRRTELAILANKSRTDVSDEDVWESFRESVNPHGADPWMLEYLKCGQLALILGDTLFVHGGMSYATLASVPGSSTAATIKPPANGDIDGYHPTTDDLPKLTQWCSDLNQFYASNINDYISSPNFVQDDSTATTQGGDWSGNEDDQQPMTKRCRKRMRTYESLLDYAVPNGNNNKTVVYANMKDHGKKEEDSLVDEYLVKNGISRVFVGHVPQGDCPLVLRRHNDELHMFMCDTSYSDISKADDAENPDVRGDAISMVTITKVSTAVNGILSNGRQHGYCLYVGEQESRNKQQSSSDLIGKLLEGGFRVRTIVPSGDTEQDAIAYKFTGYKCNKKTVNVKDESLWQSGF